MSGLHYRDRVGCLSFSLS